MARSIPFRLDRIRLGDITLALTRLRYSSSNTLYLLMLLRAVTDLHTVAELSRPQLNKKTQAEGRFSADTPTHTCSQSEVRILYPSVFLRL